MLTTLPENIMLNKSNNFKTIFFLIRKITSKYIRSMNSVNLLVSSKEKTDKNLFTIINRLYPFKPSDVFIFIKNNYTVAGDASGKQLTPRSSIKSGICAAALCDSSAAISLSQKEKY